MIVLNIIQSAIGGIFDYFMTSSRVEAIVNLDILFLNVDKLFLLKVAGLFFKNNFY